MIRRGSCPNLHAALMASAALLIAGCAGKTEPPDWTTRGTDARVAPRIDATRGKTLVFVIDPSSPGDVVRSVRLADGRTLPVVTHRVVRSIDEQNGATVRGWISAAGRWSSMPVIDAGPKATPSAMRVTLVDMPADAVGGTIWINGTPMDVNWLPDPSTLTPARPEFWPPMMPDAARNNQYLRAMLRDVAQSPLDRWRVRLLLDGLLEQSASVVFDDPVIEAMAGQVEHSWRLAFARLYSLDPALSLELKQRLSAVADFGESVVAPVWPCDAAALERLLADLLNGQSEGPLVMARAREWLDAQPRGAMWVADDGGVLDESDRPVPFIGVANLTSKPTTAWAWSGVHEPVAPDLRTLRPWSTVTMAPQRGETQPQEAALALNEAQVFLGKMSASLPVMNEAAAVVPPGEFIAGLLPDLTLEAWLYALDQQPSIGWDTRVSLFKAAQSARGEPDAGDSEWQLFVECALVPGQGQSAGEAVTVVVGPAASPRAIYRVDMSGIVQNLDLSGQLRGPWPAVKVTRTSNTWSFRLPLPRAAVEGTSLLRLGIMREDALGRRSAWPRAMMPWQRLPSRKLFDLSKWSLVR